MVTMTIPEVVREVSRKKTQLMEMRKNRRVPIREDVF
jgi:hypothetical protein